MKNIIHKLKLKRCHHKITKYRKELSKCISQDSFGIHKIVKEEYLKPVWMDGKVISVSDWTSFHKNNIQMVEGNKYLTSIVKNKAAIFIDEIQEDDPQCLVDFNIRSTCLLPIVDNDITIGFATMPIFSDYHTYDNHEKTKAIELTEKYSKYLKEMVNNG